MYKLSSVSAYRSLLSPSVVFSFVSFYFFFSLSIHFMRSNCHGFMKHPTLTPANNIKIHTSRVLLSNLQSPLSVLLRDDQALFSSAIENYYPIFEYFFVYTHVCVRACVVGWISCVCV